MSTGGNISFRYINNNARVYLAVRPKASTRNFQYYTRYAPDINRESNLLWGWTDASTVFASEIDEHCNVVGYPVSEARVIAETLKIPLVISMTTYCNLDDKIQVEEVYFWKADKLGKPIADQ